MSSDHPPPRDFLVQESSLNPGEPLESEDPLEIVHRLLLSRIVEKARFDIPAALLDETVTLENLRSIMLMPDSKEAIDCTELDTLWKKLTDYKPISCTFRDLLTLECPTFPEISKDQQFALRELCEHDIISREMVASALKVTTSSALVEFIFASGAKVLPSKILRQIQDSLVTHPDPLSFPAFLTESMIHSGRTMITFVPYVALALAAFIILPYLVSARQYAAFRTTNHFLDLDWVTGCPNGPLAPQGCNFIQKNFDTIEAVEFDVLRYFRDELPRKLWVYPNMTASQSTFGDPGFSAGAIGSTFLVGSLILRQAPSAAVSPSFKVASCSTFNLSRSILENRLPATFDCNAMWYVEIPFSYTQAQALLLAETATATMPMQKDSALIAQFASYQPSTGIVLFTSIVLTLPEGGSVIGKMQIRAIDLSARGSILPLLILNVILTGICLFLGAVYSYYGRSFWNLTTAIGVVELILIATVYGMMNGIATPEAIMQDQYSFQGLDDQADRYYIAVQIIGFWILLVTLHSMVYLAEIGALRLVVAVISAGAFEIAALVLIFAIWIMPFAYLVQLFFGPVSVELGSTFASYDVLFDFVTGGGEYDLFTAAHPYWGPTFWFVFKMFLFFFALNLLIAVLTAPLIEIKEEASLPEEICDEIQGEYETDPETPITTAVWWRFRRYTFPLVNLLIDASLNLVTKRRWLLVAYYLGKLYTPSQLTHVGEAVSHALELLDLLNPEGMDNTYVSQLAEKLHDAEGMDPVSYAFVIQTCKATSDISIIRDARILRSALLFALFKNSLDKALTLQDHLQSRAHQRSIVGPKPEHIKPEELEQPFHYTVYLETVIRGARLSALYFLIVFVLFIWFFASGLSQPKPTAFLTESVNVGLLDRPMKEECFDANCTTAMSFKKTFEEVYDLPDFYQFLEKVFIPQMFIRTDSPALFNNVTSASVYWDSRTTFDTPIYFRQLRSVPMSSCSFGNTPSKGDFANPTYTQRLASLAAAFKCYDPSSSNLAMGPIPGPVAAGVDPAAYQYSSFCPERRGLGFLGRYASYPCNGYTAKVYNSSSVRALEAANWFDQATRFIAITTTFHSGSVSVEYSLYLEVGEGGGSAIANRFATPLSEDATALQNQIIASMILMSYELIFYFYFVGIKLFQEYVLGQRSSAPAKFPTYVLYLYVLTLFLPFVAYYQGPAVNERAKTMLVMIGFVITFLAAKVCFFPIAGMLSRRSWILFETVWFSMKSVSVVIPFYVVSIWGFAYAAMMILGLTSPDFVSVRNAFLRVFRGAFGDWAFRGFDAQNSDTAPVLSILFFLLQLVIIANLILAMVVTAAEESLAIDQSLKLAAHISKQQKWHIMYGEFYQLLLSANVIFIRFMRERGEEVSSKAGVAALCYGEGRLLLSSECLLAIMGPNRTNDVLTTLCVDQLHPLMYPSCIAYILDTHATYIKSHGVDDCIDNIREKHLIREKFPQNVVRSRRSSRQSQRSGELHQQRSVDHNDLHPHAVGEPTEARCLSVTEHPETTASEPAKDEHDHTKSLSS